MNWNLEITPEDWYYTVSDSAFIFMSRLSLKGLDYISKIMQGIEHFLENNVGEDEILALEHKEKYNVDGVLKEFFKKDTISGLEFYALTCACYGVLAVDDPTLEQRDPFLAKILKWDSLDYLGDRSTCH